MADGHEHDAAQHAAHDAVHEGPRDEHGRPLSRQRRRKRLRRAAKVLAGLLVGTVVLAGGAVLVLTNTDWGRERVRRFALGQLRNAANGEVRIGALRGNLLSGATIEDIVIRDSAGQPFVAIERLRARYSIPDLLRKRLVFRDVSLFRPVVVLDRPPEGDWNFRRIFPEDTTPSLPGDTLPGFGDWLSLRNVRITDGRVVVRLPWRPDEELSPAGRDSAARVALAGGSRNRVIAVDGGYQRVMEFRSLSGRFPLLQLRDPEREDMLVRVATLRGTLAPFMPPVGELRDLAGDFHVWSDSITFPQVRGAFPGSRIAGGGRYVIDTGELQLAMRGAPAALADFRWAYPRLPSQGGGTLGFRMHWLEEPEEVQRYQLVDADVRVGESHLVGDLGFTLTDTVEFHDTRLRVADFDTRLMEQLIEGFEMPRNGFVTGRLALAGGLADLHLDADVAFRDPLTGTSRAEIAGVMGFGDEGFVKADDLRMRLYPAQVGLARIFLPDFPLEGTLTGVLTLDGTPARWIASSADVVHEDLGQRSHIVGTAAMGFGPAPARELASLDVEVRFSPLALAPTLGRYADLGFRGATAGRLRLTGPMRDLRLDTRLRTPDGGVLTAVGAMDLASERIGYNLRAGLDVFDASVLLSGLPRTALSLDAAARGRGTDPATMFADVAVAARASRWDRVAVDSGRLALTVAEGLLRLDTLRVAGPGIDARAGGTFGLAASRTGELGYSVEVDSLGAFRRWIPSDTGVVAPRPAVLRRALARARGDSIALARATEARRAITGEPMPVVAVDTPSAVPRDSLAGTVWAAGRVAGSIRDFSLRGRAAARGLVVSGNTVEAARAEYAWAGAPSTAGRIVVAANLDTVAAAGFAFEHVEARAAHGMGQNDGRLQLLLRQEDEREYATHVDYRFHPGHDEVHLDDVRIRFDTTTWASARPSVVRWGGAGVEVDELDLRRGETGRVYVDGVLPRAEGAPADLRVVVNDFEIGDVSRLAQTDVDASGRLSLSGRASGTLATPRFTVAAGVLQPVYGGTALPQLRGAFEYDGRVLQGTVEARRRAQVVASAEGRLPVRLGTGGTGPRVARDAALDATIVADSLPLEALPQFTDLVSNVRGRAVGRVRLGGTLAAPRLAGALALDLGSFRVVPTGMRLSNLEGRLRFLGDSIVIDTLAGWARSGPVALEGGLGIAQLTEPTFDLRLTASDARILDNEQGRINADIEASMYGPFERTYVNGRVRVRGGVIYLPESDNRQVLTDDDPALFAVTDTSITEVRELIPTASDFMENLRVSLGLKVDRDTWVRSREANVEIFSDDWLRIALDQGRSSLTLDGVVSTERGEYTFLSRRFQIRRGSATFIGTTDINPTVQATAEYEVRLPAREALFIRLLIGGTVRNPRLTLESTAQPPIAQSDLLAYLAFGRSSGSLLQLGGSGLGSGQGNLAGATAAIARNQIAAIALGVAVNELERDAARGLNLDVFNITPADVQTELLAGRVGGFAGSTEIEAGRYWNEGRLFGAVQTRISSLLWLAGSDVALPPGLTLQYRIPRGLILESSYTPRYLLSQPTLERQELSPTAVLGMFLIKEWRF